MYRMLLYVQGTDDDVVRVTTVCTGCMYGTVRMAYKVRYGMVG